MPQKGLVGSRAVVERNFAILPPEGIPESVLPAWSGTACRVLASPAMGAGFARAIDHPARWRPFFMWGASF